MALPRSGSKSAAAPVQKAWADGHAVALPCFGGGSGDGGGAGSGDGGGGGGGGGEGEGGRGGGGSCTHAPAGDASRRYMV